VNLCKIMSGSSKNNNGGDSLAQYSETVIVRNKKFKIVTDMRAADIIDVNRAKSCDTIQRSQNIKKSNNVNSESLDNSSKFSQKKRGLESGDYNIIRKKVKHVCYELEEVNDTGLCSDTSGEDAVDTSDEDKFDESVELETFNDLSQKIRRLNNPLTRDKWLAKIVAHDHDYHGTRVRFSGATVWYFDRHQYSSSVPSEGDVAMGMEMKHSHTEHVTIDHNTQDLSLSNISKIKSKRKARVGGRLKPLSMSARVSLLRSHGILQIDREESADIEKLQTSRANESGCNCVGSCLPETCSCFINQVECEVDSEGFPCKCDSHTNCHNPLGRRFFNRKEVDMHRWNQVDANTSNTSEFSKQRDAER